MRVALHFSHMVWSCHDLFFEWSFHFSTSTVQLKPKECLNVWAGLWSFCRSVRFAFELQCHSHAAPHLFLHVHPFYASLHHLSPRPLYLNAAMSMPIAMFTKLSHRLLTMIVVFSHHVVGPFPMASVILLPPFTDSGWPTLYGITAYNSGPVDSYLRSNLCPVIHCRRVPDIHLLPAGPRLPVHQKQQFWLHTGGGESSLCGNNLRRRRRPII